MQRIARVGLTATAGLACAAALVVFLGRIHFARPGYPLTVRFGYVDSLRSAAPVLYGGGVKIGTVEELGVEEGRVAVRLNILKAVRIPADSEISIHTSGILGEKYVQVEAGDAAAGFLQPGAVVEGVDPGSLDRALQRLESLAEVLEPLLRDPAAKRGVRGLFGGLQRLVDDLQSMLGENRGDLRSAVSDLKATAAELRQRSAELKPVLAGAGELLKPANAAKARSALENLDASLQKLDRMLAHVEQKKGPLGLLVYDDETGEAIREMLSDLKRHPWKLLWKK